MENLVAPVAVIMAGGSGTRFWPISRSARPKQLVQILGDTTMIQATVARLLPLLKPERIMVITTAALLDETRRQLPLLDPSLIIGEPVGRDTAACVALAALIAERRFPGAPLVLLPADQVISPTDRFQAALAAGIEAARAGALVTYGIRPRFAATGYGYIQVGSLLTNPAPGIRVEQVQRFVEKPALPQAEVYVADPQYRWNSGIFTWKSSVVLQQLAQHVPWLTKALEPVAAALDTPQFATVLANAYQDLRRVSIDYALMEHAQGIQVVTGDFQWDDVGSWDSLYDHQDADANGLRQRGPVTAIDCHNSLLVSAGGPRIAAIGLHGVTVVSTADAVLVIPHGASQRVKEIVEALRRDQLDRLL